jgi:hypothetical protein
MPSTILSDNGVTSGSAGLKTTAASDGALALQTTTAGGTATTALTISTAQNVGIGVTTPLAKLHIAGVASNTALYAQGVAANLYVDYNGNGNNYLDGTAHYLRNFAGSIRGGFDFSSVNTAFTLTAGTGGYAAQYINSTGTGYLVYQTNSVETGRVIVDSSSNLIFGTGSSGTERMRIDSSGNVGIGQTPTYKLDVLGSTTRIYNDSATLLLQRPSNSRSGQILINNANGGIKYYAGSNGSGENSVVAHEFVSDAPSTGTVLARINSFGIGLGANTPSSGTGITFPATQSASSDANTLDDYEEGTWTPTMVASGASFTYSATYGTYVKIGSFVMAQFYLRVTAYTGSNSNTAIGGLPFTSANINAFSQYGTSLWSTTSVAATPLVQNNQAVAEMWKQGTSVTIFTASEVINAYFVGCLTYRTA